MRKIVLTQVSEKGAGKETVFSIFRHCLPPGITMGIHLLSSPLLATFIHYLTQQDGLSEKEIKIIIAITMKRRVLADPNLIVGLDGTCWLTDEIMIRSFPPDVLSILIYTTADPDVRYERLKKKENDGEELSREQFDHKEANTKRFIYQIGEKADWKIENNGTREELTEKVNEFFRHKIRPVLALLRLKTTIS